MANKYLGCEYHVIDMSKGALQKIGKRLLLIGFFESNVVEVRQFLNSDTFMICRDNFGALPIFVNGNKFKLLTNK